MKAFRVHEHGGLEALRREEVPDPAPGPGEIRVRVEAISINHLDLWVRRGVSGHRFPLPLIPGCDVVGRVEDPPEGSPWRSGDRVAIAPSRGCGRCERCAAGDEPLCRRFVILGESIDGGAAEWVCAPESHLLPLPDGVTVAEAVSLPLALLTAWHMLIARAQLQPGETVLVQAGGSGVGSMALQIGKLLGAHVFTTVGSDEKAVRARALGADEVINYRRHDFVEEVRRLTGKAGVDVIVDHVGADTFADDIRCLRKGGRLVVCGATTGPEVSFDLRHLFFKSLSFLGSTMGRLDELHQAMRMVSRGRIVPVVDRVFPMNELPNAHEHLEARRAFGKVVVSGFGVDPAEIQRR